MRVLTATIAAAAALASHAVDVDISFTAYDHAVEYYVANGRSTASPWISATNSIRGAGGGAHLGADNLYFGIPLSARFTADGASASTGAFISWQNRGDPLSARLTQGLSQTGAHHVDVAISDVAKCPAFGWVQAPYVDQRLEHGVLTMRGDPCSTVVNGTSRDLVVNGVTLYAGRGARLPFPFHLKMEEVEGIRFYDLATGDEFAPYAYTPTYSGETTIYYDGTYSPMWTGDFMFKADSGRPADVATSNLLLYADMADGGTEAAGVPLHGADGAPVYAGFVYVSTNVALNTWWEFGQNQWGSSPKAKINGEVVCGAHCTGHMIPYRVNAEDMSVSETSGEGSFYFSMSQEPMDGYSGGSCVMRVWDGGLSATSDGYAAAPQEHRAEVSAGTGTAWFRVTANVYKGTWKVEAL